VSTSHVDDGTLQAYLDGELSPADAQGVDAHLAQCPLCRGRLAEERALIARAAELLALAAPPDRELPPFRAGDLKSPTRLWWQVRRPLAWAATVVLALGIGTYLGSGVEQLPKSKTSADAETGAARALLVPVTPEVARREVPTKARRATAAQAAARPAAPAPGVLNEADRVARQRDEQVGVRPEAPRFTALARDAAPTAAAEKKAAAKLAASPAAAMVGRDNGRYVRKGSPISVDSARVLLGADPLVVPGLPIRAIYGAREIGSSAIVIVEQTVDSGTVIEVINGRLAAVALDQVVVTGAGAAAARPDSSSLAGRTQLGPTAAPAERRRAPSDLFSDVRGPLPPDSLQALRRRLQPLRP
jgi:hypothetical protein